MTKIISDESLRRGLAHLAPDQGKRCGQVIGQLYRDRADCENGFDELKNQWGWGGYTTHDSERGNCGRRLAS